MSAPGTALQGWRWLRGRAGRREFCAWMAVIFVWGALFVWAHDPIPQQILSLAFWLQVVRRLHDLGRSGWWIAAFLFAHLELGVVALYAPNQPWAAWAPSLLVLAGLIFVAAVPGERHENRFGPGRRRAAAPDAA